MNTFWLFAFIFGLFSWGLYKLFRYTAQTVGDESPIYRLVRYAYREDDLFKWSNALYLVVFVVFWFWICWIMVANLHTATRFWHYALFFLALTLWLILIWLTVKLTQLERRLWQSVIGHTAITLDPQTQSITVERHGECIQLTAENTLSIDRHWINQGRFSYQFYLFTNRNGDTVRIFDYGNGFLFGIEAYFKGIPVLFIEHRYPFRSVLSIL